MHLISAGKLKKAASKYPDVATTIKAFCKTIDQAQWRSLIDVQQVYRDAEAVGNFTVFNIKGLTGWQAIDKVGRAGFSDDQLLKR